jgi:hypothetical protein
MTTKEFSDGFDTLVMSRVSNVPLEQITFDEYEKSYFLTKAQTAFVISLYNGGITSTTFEGSEEMREYLKDLIVIEPLEVKGDTITLPSDVLFITQEIAILENSNEALGVPIKHDHLYLTLQNPFRGPTCRRVIREDTGGSTAKLYSTSPVKEYKITYLKKPTPIVLEDFDDLTIEGYSEVTECILNPVLHNKILDYAVGLALQSRGVGQS